MNTEFASPSGSASRSLLRRSARPAVSLLGMLALVCPLRAARAQGSGSSGQAASDTPPPVSAELKNRCADAYEATQRERAAGHLLLARKNGIFCAQNSCPEVLRSDCAKWTDELASSIPALVIEVRSPSGEVLSNVYVELDGQAFADHLDGRAVELDPGQHHFRFEAIGLVPREQDFVLLEQHAPQHLRVMLEPEPVPPREKPGFPVASYALAGVGVAALGSFAYFGLSGNHKKAALESCKPACEQSLKPPIERDYLAADVSLGVSLVSLGIATYLALSSPRAEPETAPRSAVRVGAGPGAASLAFERTF